MDRWTAVKWVNIYQSLWEDRAPWSYIIETELCYEGHTTMKVSDCQDRRTGDLFMKHLVFHFSPDIFIGAGKWGAFLARRCEESNRMLKQDEILVLPSLGIRMKSPLRQSRGGAAIFSQVLLSREK
jgi:hypothetical protein